MRKHRILTITGATALLGLAGVVGSTVTQAAPQRTVQMITLGRYHTGTVTSRCGRWPRTSRSSPP